MISASSQSDDVGGGGRNIGETKATVTPGNDGSVTPQSQAAAGACGNLDDVTEAGRDVGLTVVVEAPGGYGGVCQ